MDGHSSGAIVAFGLEKQGVNTDDILFYRMNYGQAFDDSLIDYKNDKIYIVDFSLQPYEKMEELSNKANLVWIDHHITSVNWAKTTQFKVDGKLEEGLKAACELCWEYFFPLQSTPDLIKRISQYDIWNKEYPDYNWEDEQIPLQTYLYNIETRPEEAMDWWTEQLSITPNSQKEMDSICKMICEGRTLSEFKDKQLKSLTKANGYEAELCGYKVFAANTANRGSRQFELVVDMNDYDIVCSFALYQGKYWIVNLYSIKEEINCGSLAKQLGSEGPCKSGGGHPGAAGFQTSTDHLFSILKPIPKEND
jgi:oligoribonuclease NrnB/cAMP/cGMP phosphodiesterase (DHH superfamily)